MIDAETASGGAAEFTGVGVESETVFALLGDADLEPFVRVRGMEVEDEEEVAALEDEDLATVVGKDVSAPLALPEVPHLGHREWPESATQWDATWRWCPPRGQQFFDHASYAGRPPGCSSAKSFCQGQEGRCSTEEGGARPTV